MKITDIVPGDSGTRVVNVKDGEAYDVRVDRSTPWGNPWTHQPFGTRAQHIVGSREEAVELHANWFPSQLALLVQLHKLRGKTLGCHCWPKPCHATTLAKAADGPLGDPSMEAAELLYNLPRMMLDVAMPYYIGCIGTRQPDRESVELWRHIGRYIVKHGACVRTGNAEGIDQAAAAGGNSVDPQGVSLVLPWQNYEKQAVHPGNRLELADLGTETMQIVQRCHPAVQHLTAGAWALHGRNVSLVRPCKFVLAQARGRPGSKTVPGGTGMGMAVCKELNVTVLDLREPQVRQVVASIVRSTR